MSHWSGKSEGGPFIQTASGRYFHFFDPQQDEIDIEDIAHALSQICRYTGHTAEFYSVAQHSVLVARHSPVERKVEGLLHDAHEAYVHDISSPLKSAMRMQSGTDAPYDVLSGRADTAIRRKFGLPTKMSQGVQRADLVMLITEMRDLMPPGLVFDGAPLPFAEKVKPLGPREAKRLFLDTYAALTHSVAA